MSLREILANFSAFSLHTVHEKFVYFLIVFFARKHKPRCGPVPAFVDKRSSTFNIVLDRADDEQCIRVR